MEKISIAIVGFGYWSPKLIRNFGKCQNAHIAAVCEKDETKWPAIKELLPETKIYLHYTEALQNTDIQAVVIATTVSSHYRIAQEALLQNKHVLIEKPMTITGKEADRLVRLAQKKQRILMVDHTFIYSPPIQELKRLIDEQTLGDMYSYQSSRLNLGLFQRDVNVLYDLAPHDFSILRYLIPEKPKDISAIGSCPIHHPLQTKPQESIVYVSVRYPSGLIAHIHVSWLSPIKVRKTTLIGSKKMALYDLLDPQGKIKIYDQGVELREVQQRYEPLFDYRIGSTDTPSIRETEDLEEVAKDFLRCIEQGAKPLVDGTFGRDVVYLLEAAQRSLNKKGKWVSV